MGADAQAKASATRASTVLKVGAILALCVVAYFGYFYEPSPPLLPATGDIGQDLRQRNNVLLARFRLPHVTHFSTFRAPAQ